jgi:hypothetical protein
MDEEESKSRDRKVTVERKAEGVALRLGPCHYDMNAELVAQYLPF